MKKITTIAILISIWALAPAVLVKAVISEEFGGSKSNQDESKPAQVIDSGEVEQKVETNVVTESNVTTKSESRKEPENNDNDENKSPVAEHWTDTMEIAIDNGSLSPIKISAENVSVQDDKLLFFSTTDESVNEFQVKTALPTFVNKLVKAWSLKGDATSIENFEIKIKEGKPIYEVSVKGTGKLFGLFPIKLERKAIISAVTEEVKEVEQPWYSFLVRKQNLFKI